MIAKTNSLWDQKTVNRINTLTALLGQQYPWFNDLPTDKQFDYTIRFLNAEKMGIQRYKIVFVDFLALILSIGAIIITILKQAPCP